MWCKRCLAATDGKDADLVYDPTYALSSFAQSAACVAAGGAWVKLGLFKYHPGSEAYAKVAESRDAAVCAPTFGRWVVAIGQGEQPYMNEQYVMTQVLRDALGWYESGQVRPYVSHMVECEPTELRRTLNELDSVNVGKIALHISNSW